MSRNRRRAQVNGASYLMLSVQPIEDILDLMKLYPKLKKYSREDELSRSFVSAYRMGIGNQRFGLFKCAPSDHLPVSFSFQGKQCLTWNLLADKYLVNSFFNLSGLNLLAEKISATNGYHNRCHIFMKDFASFLLEKWDGDGGSVKITHDDFAEFISMGDQGLGKDREEMATIICDTSDVNHPEYLMCLEHALQMQLLLDSGALSWKKRLQLIAENKELVATLKQHDFVCLQECTEPNDILKLMQSKNSQYRVITHTVEDNTNDHCAIIYDANKFEEIK